MCDVLKLEINSLKKIIKNMSTDRDYFVSKDHWKHGNRTNHEGDWDPANLAKGWLYDKFRLF